MSDQIAALVTDLIFATKITSTASALGLSVKVVQSFEALGERLASGTDSTIIIDLNADGVDAIRAVELCHAAAHKPRTIAYASHVHVGVITAARAAGADEVMARSAFVTRLPAILGTALHSSERGEP